MTTTPKPPSVEGLMKLVEDLAKLAKWDKPTSMAYVELRAYAESLTEGQASDASLREIDLALAAMVDLKPLVEYGTPGSYDTVQARRKTALLRAEGALLFLRRELGARKERGDALLREAMEVIESCGAYVPTFIPGGDVNAHIDRRKNCVAAIRAHLEGK